MRLSNAAGTPSTTSFVPLYTPSFSYRLRSALRAMTGRGKSSCAGAYAGDVRTEPDLAAREVAVALEPSAVSRPEPAPETVAEHLPELLAEQLPEVVAEETPAPPVAASEPRRPTAPNRIPAPAAKERMAPAAAAQRRRRTSAAARTNMAVEKPARPVHVDR